MPERGFQWLVSCPEMLSSRHSLTYEWCNRCDAYNLATAASCLLCVAFGFSVFFDIKDLHASNMSPRTRTSRA